MRMSLLIFSDVKSEQWRINLWIYVSIFKTVHWINNTDYKHIAVVRYDSDLNNKLVACWTWYSGQGVTPH
jgi:hypothetical protein